MFPSKLLDQKIKLVGQGWLHRIGRRPRGNQAANETGHRFHLSFGKDEKFLPNRVADSPSPQSNDREDEPHSHQRTDKILDRSRALETDHPGIGNEGWE
jgi:hypothetical protein